MFWSTSPVSTAPVELSHQSAMGPGMRTPPPVAWPLTHSGVPLSPPGASKTSTISTSAEIFPTFSVQTSQAVRVSSVGLTPVCQPDASHSSPDAGPELEMAVPVGLPVTVAPPPVWAVPFGHSAIVSADLHAGALWNHLLLLHVDEPALFTEHLRAGRRYRQQHRQPCDHTCASESHLCSPSSLVPDGTLSLPMASAAKTRPQNHGM